MKKLLSGIIKFVMTCIKVVGIGLFAIVMFYFILVGCKISGWLPEEKAETVTVEDGFEESIITETILYENVITETWD